MSEILDTNQTQNKTEQNCENLCKKYPKMQNLHKKVLEISLNGVAELLIYTGKTGVWLSNLANELKDDTQKARLSKINEEQVKINGIEIISHDLVKDVIAKRLKTEVINIYFAQIYLAKKDDLTDDEYFYEIEARFNNFLYHFKIKAIDAEILNIKVKS